MPKELELAVDVDVVGSVIWSVIAGSSSAILLSYLSSLSASYYDYRGNIVILFLGAGRNFPTGTFFPQWEFFFPMSDQLA